MSMREIYHDIKVEQVILDRLKYRLHESFSPMVMQSFRIEQWRDQMLDRMVYTLEAEMLAEKLAEKEIEVRFDESYSWAIPASWWQHLKHDFNNFVWRHPKLPRWLMRRVKYDTNSNTISKTKKVLLEQFAAFPQHNIATPEDVRGPVVVRYERVTTR